MKTLMTTIFDFFFKSFLYLHCVLFTYDCSYIRFLYIISVLFIDEGIEEFVYGVLSIDDFFYDFDRPRGIHKVFKDTSNILNHQYWS